MAVILVLPDLERLANVFVVNRRTEPAEMRPLFASARLERAAWVLRAVLVVSFAGFSLVDSYQDSVWFAARTEEPLHGMWLVEEFAVDGATRPPHPEDESRWQRVVFDYPGVVAVQSMTDSRQRFAFELDSEGKTITLRKRFEPDWRADLSFDAPESELMRWRGAIDGHHIHATLRRTAVPEFRLTSRGFNWINEYPFNR
jgi:hypothetical protein